MKCFYLFKKSQTLSFTLVNECQMVSYHASLKKNLSLHFNLKIEKCLKSDYLCCFKSNRPGVENNRIASTESQLNRFWEGGN